jgi:HEAT repeat protein
MINFIDTFKVVSEGHNLEDDVVTLLWEKNIEHITYSVSEGFIEEELPVDSELLMEEAGDELAPMGAMYMDVVLAPSVIDFEVAPVNADEMNTLQHEIQRFEGDVLLSEATELFLELMTTERDIEGFKEFTRNIGKMIDVLLEKDSIEEVTELLSRLIDIRESGISSEYKKIIDDVIDMAGSEDKLGKLFIRDKNLDSAQAYMLLLNKNAIQSLLNILGELEDRKTRRYLCNILSVIGKQAVEAFASGIHDKKWYLVRNTLMILGIMKDPAAIKYIEGTMTHPDLRVRKEAVKALDSIGTEEIKGPFMIALRDSDAGIRTSALKTLRRFGDKKLFDIVKERVLAGDLKERPFTEKKEMFEALAETGGDMAFPILSEFFKKKGLFRKTETEELRACAAYGLGILGTREAVMLLEKGLREKEGFFSDACKKSLARTGVR